MTSVVSVSAVLVSTFILQWPLVLVHEECHLSGLFCFGVGLGAAEDRSLVHSLCEAPPAILRTWMPQGTPEKNQLRLPLFILGN